MGSLVRITLSIDAEDLWFWGLEHRAGVPHLWIESFSLPSDTVFWQYNRDLQ